jgi:transcriptional regulator with XRE-family HTH domain
MDMADMSPSELREHFNALNVSRQELAQLLGVSKRTVTRWSEGEEIPGPAAAAIRAWRSLNDRQLAWKPDSISVLENDEDQIERFRKYAIRFDEMLKQVERRGGPIHPWKVDFHRSTAIFGTSEITFYKLANGGISINSYRRSDRQPDLTVDMPLIQDAAYCIAHKYAKFEAQASALADIASYVRTNSAVSARSGQALPTSKQAAEQKRHIESLAAQLQELAEAARDGFASYSQYEDIQDRLHAAGFFPKDSLVAAVARAFT